MFKQRSYKKELLDAEDIPTELLHQNLNELEQVNKWLGGISISLKGVQYIAPKNDKISIADIGCGGGDFLASCALFATREKFNIQLTGIDNKQDCIDYAREHCKAYPEITFICDDYKQVLRHNDGITHIHMALFCHHLTDEEILELIMLCGEKKIGIIINDLHRHPLAYYGIYILTRILNGSHLVKNDAPLSVLRGFKKKEWRKLLHESGVSNSEYTMSWEWAFRHLLIIDWT